MAFFCAPMLTYKMYAALRCSKTIIFATPDEFWFGLTVSGALEQKWVSDLEPRAAILTRSVSSWRTPTLSGSFVR
jgi:hypothetical protein